MAPRGGKKGAQLGDAAKRLFDGLTPSQLAAMDTSINLAVLAGAGSGKTTVLSRRYVRLLEAGRVSAEANQAGVGESAPLRPGEILTLTFTRKAAAEMRERIARLVTERTMTVDDATTDEVAEADRRHWLGILDELDLAPISTIHGWCRQTLEEFSLRAGLDPAFDICDDFTWNEVMADAVAHAIDEAEEEGTASLAWLAKSWRRDEVVEAVAELLRQSAIVGEVIDRMPSPGEDGVIALLLGDNTDAAFELFAQELARDGRLSRFARETERLLAAVGITRDDADRWNELPAARMVDQINDASVALVGGDQLGLLAALADACAEALTGKGEVYSPRSVQTHFYKLPKKYPPGKQLAEIEDGNYAKGAEVIVEVVEMLDTLPSRADLELAPDIAALLELYQLAEKSARELFDSRHLLTQDDLLLETRKLLATHPEVLAVLRGRFRQIMVDEFQDTDPVQWDIVRMLAEEDAPPSPSSEPPTVDDNNDPTRKSGNRIGAARLFLVGDDKQSIYRFRGADVAVFAEAARAISADADRGRVIELADNFRTLPRVLRAINSLGDRLFHWDEEEDGSRPPYEAAAQPLSPGLEPHLPTGTPNGDVTFALYRAWKRSDDRDDDADIAPVDDNNEERDPIDAAWDMLEPMGAGEAAARAVLWALGRTANASGPLMIRGSGDEPSRPATPDDIMVLLQTRGNLVSLERALQARGIPYVVEGGTGFYQAQEVYDVRNLLAVLSEPDDDIALAGVLRGPFFSLTDRALSYLSTLAGDTWSAKLSLAARAAQDEGDDSVDEINYTEARRALSELTSTDRQLITEADDLLSRWRLAAPHLALSDLIQLAFDETGAWAALGHGGKGPQRLANIDKLTSVARQFESAGMRGAAAFVEYLDQMDDEFGVREGLADTGDDRSGVRVMTVHGSKGREAPVVILADADRFSGAHGGRAMTLREQVVGDEGGVRVELAVRPPQWLKDGGAKSGGGGYRRIKTLQADVQDREEAEGRRLFYVAATRARDHLVLVGGAEVHRSRRWMKWLFAGIAGDKPKEDTHWLRRAMLGSAWPPQIGEDGDVVPGSGPPAWLAGITPWSLHDAEPVGAPVTAGQPVVSSTNDNESAASDIIDLFGDATGDEDAPEVIAFAERNDAPQRAAAAPESPQARRTLLELPASSAALLESDPAAFYRDVILGYRPPEALAVKRPARSLSAAEIGTLVHRAFQEGVQTADEARELALREAAGFGLFREDKTATREVEKAARIVVEAVEQFATSDLGALLSRPEWTFRREAALAVILGGLRFSGRLDLLALPNGSGKDAAGLLIDFKTTDVRAMRDAPSPEDAAVILAEDATSRGYFSQLGLYAMATDCERCAAVSSAAARPLRLGIYYTRYATTVWRDWTPADAEALRQRAADWERRIAELDFGELWPTDSCDSID